MKILELFSGYGTASFALKRLGIPYEIIGFSDIDKYANQCFFQNHWRNIKPLRFSNNPQRQLGDVKLINPNDLEDFDLLTAGFPCQAFSNAGKMQGELDPRGSLFYEIIRIAEVKKPKYMLLENVKGLTCKKFKDTFDKILSELDRIGYHVHWKVLNSKDFGIPQSRARVWFVCFREQEDYDKFKFPEQEELKIFIKDILESEVDKKYYLSPLLQERFAKYLEEKNRIVNLQPRQGKGIGGKGIISKNDGTTYCVDQTCGQGIVSVQMANMNRGKIPYDPNNSEMGFQLNKEPISFTIKQAQHEFLVANCIKVGGLPTKPEHYYEKKHSNIAGVSGALRRLTPKECFRLMGFLNDEINLEGLSDTQRYKLAGNGQDVNMVTKIFERMFK
jgi:DNA (cytosine-5)-methyltransferase 1